MTDDINALERTYADFKTVDLLHDLLLKRFKRRIALVSSFGADAAVLLHMISTIDPKTPVLFIDTHMLFKETLDYRDQLAGTLGLEDVRTIVPLGANERDLDAKGVLWASEPTRCCYFRKVLPLQRALEGFDAWITGRKHYQSVGRASLPTFELADQRVKVNPLIGWQENQIKAYFEAHELPVHPLVAQGYPSIGCLPCTTRVAAGEDPRSGRWRGQEKTECGIHISPNGQISRAPGPMASRLHGCG